MAADRSLAAPAPARMSRRAGALVAMEGLWGAGKSTVARQLGERTAAMGFRTCVLHYGHRDGVIGRLSEFLDTQPLRNRAGAGGYALPHHATVDVLLRLCREASSHTRLYRPALENHDLVILDHGVYTKLAYYLTVLRESHPGSPDAELLGALRRCCDPWFLAPDRAFYLDVPWPLARERAISRGTGGGNPGSLERLMFLPCYDAALRYVAAAEPGRIARVPVGLRPARDVTDAVERELLSTVLRVPDPHGGTGE